MSEERRRQIIKSIAFIQVGFGTAGLIMATRMVYLFAKRGTPIGGTFALDMLVPFALSLAAGLLLRRGKALGEILSITNLGLQVPLVLTSAFSFYYTAGLSLEVWINSNRIGFDWYLGNRLHIAVDENLPVSWVGINVVALALVVLLVMALPGDQQSRESQSA